MKKDYCRILRRGGFLLFALTFWFFTSCSNLGKDESSENHNSEDNEQDRILIFMIDQV